jgi:hypothetical protein
MEKCVRGLREESDIEMVNGTLCFVANDVLEGNFREIETC